MHKTYQYNTNALLVMLLHYAALKSLLMLPFVLLNTSRDHRNLEKDGTIGSRFKL